MTIGRVAIRGSAFVFVETKIEWVLVQFERVARASRP